MKYEPLLVLAVLVIASAPTPPVQAAEDLSQEHRHANPINWFSLVKPLGAATLCCVCATFLAGVFRRRLGRRFLKIHVPLAILSVLLGLAHGILVFSLYH
jgi:O-antigen ligase